MTNRILLIALLASGFNDAAATHIYGGQITYACLGNNDYDVRVTLYQKCSGVLPFTQFGIDIFSSCGTMGVAAPLIASTDVSQLCAASMPQSTCNGGVLQGYAEHVFSVVVNIPPCDDWSFEWDICCRGYDIVNLAAADTDDIQLSTTMDNLLHPCNDSPVLEAPPFPFVCVNQPVNFSYEGSDPDCDSLRYSLIPAAGVNGVPLVYATGYSGAQPLPGATIHPTTGLLSFTPTTVGSHVVVVLVEQFDTQGNLIGTIRRDAVFMVMACTNTVPDLGVGAITNVSGNASLTNSTSIHGCDGGSFCFDVTFSDPDVADTLQLAGNWSQIMPGATMTTTGTNPITATLCWSPYGIGQCTYPFTITVSDDVCPIPAIQGFVYTVTVDACVGISEDGILDSGMHLFPNPVSVGSSFRVSGIPKDASPTLTTIDGRRVRANYRLDGDDLIVDASGLPAGSYLISSGGGQVMRFVVVGH